MSPENDEDARGGLTRRRLITTAAWAAPVIVVATAVPAAAASAVPTDSLTVVVNTPGYNALTGTIIWTGGQIIYNGGVDNPDQATVPWTVTIDGPMGAILPPPGSNTGTETIDAGFSAAVPGFEFPAQGPGTYVIRLTVTGSTGTTFAEKSIIVA